MSDWQKITIGVFIANSRKIFGKADVQLNLQFYKY